MCVATRDSIKKNNKLSKVDWGINIINTKNNASLEKRILKKKSTLNYFSVFKLVTPISLNILCCSLAYICDSYSSKVLLNWKSRIVVSIFIIKRSYFCDSRSFWKEYLEKNKFLLSKVLTNFYLWVINQLLKTDFNFGLKNFSKRTMD